MLNRVLDLVAAKGWFDQQRPFETTINLTQGACLWLMLTRQGVCDTYVKFSDCADLTQEARRCEAASRWYPELVPAFVGFVQCDGLDVLVCRAVDSRALNVRRLQSPAARDTLLRGLQPYFEAMPRVHLSAALVANSNRGLSASLAAYFEHHPLAALARRWLDRDALQLLDTLPELPQHGDLVLNNIGQLSGGRVILFDWEDFGASCLPGLDLFTLELTLAGDAMRLAQGRTNPADPMQRFVAQACRLIGIEPAQYVQLTPVYALVFRYLKRNYGPGVRERMDALLTDLAQQRAMADV
jgi:hypothetical protein